eukprot:CAMPEP_0170506798 /NCGR_PEP_ID=MMETSP0208-20121228/56353_1 /TAXON_ID=197538 /ORGANISM="Strombidium inclinatum, Strain S3" /LENGTH=70 /DNA_ID=CAMNT_0010788577 /DNA_START=463 /DNA_END=671 /DNA_ORIENTATION=-
MSDFDLMRVFFRILGDQREYDLSFISSKRSKKFVSELCHQKLDRIKFDQEFKNSNKHLASLVEQCLQFNP